MTAKAQRKPKRSINERVADADARGGAWLAKANEYAERGDKARAEKCYDKVQYWMDLSNKLRGCA